VSGWIEADFLDEFEEDLTSTDRQVLAWDFPEAEDLREYLQAIVRHIGIDWSRKRKQVKEEKTTERTGVNIKDWMATLPEIAKKSVEKIVGKVGDNPALSDEDYSHVVRELHQVVPPYPTYHWRYLHPEIQRVSFPYYANKDYYNALFEACKQYVEPVKNKVCEKAPKSLDVLSFEDRNLMGKVFGQGKDTILKITLNKVQSNGRPLSKFTKNSLEDAQMLLSQGILVGYRNPIAHTKNI
jgi:hypothetical protein